MKMNKDQIKGRAKESEGTFTERAGKMEGDQTLESKGKNERLLGEAQAKFGDLKHDLKDAKRNA